jgi:transcriptional regulator with XRE-family HTH domain
VIARAPRKNLNVCGKELLRLRSERGLSQTELATKCQLAGWDTSRDIINRIERRIRRVDDLDLATLARVLGVKIEELYPAKIRSRLP